MAATRFISIQSKTPAASLMSAWLYILDPAKRYGGRLVRSSHRRR